MGHGYNINITAWRADEGVLFFSVLFNEMCLIGGSRGGGGSGSGRPLKNKKNIGFPSNIDPDSLKITKLPNQHSMVGHYRHASETPF